MSLRTSTAEADRRVGANVREARIRAGLSQVNLGDALGLTFQQVQKYEKGANRIGVGTLHLIAGVVGAPAAALMDVGAAEAEARPSLITPETVRLLSAFVRIADAGQRRRLVSLVESMAEPQPEGPAS